MITKVFENKASTSKAAAIQAAEILRALIVAKGNAVIIVATGTSQFDFLANLCAAPGIDWSKVRMFHLDEYVGLSDQHPASFRKYLKERLLAKVGIKDYHLIQGDAPDIHAEMARMNGLIKKYNPDLAFVGIGENGHLAFNDPPADFEAEDPYIIVTLDKKCKKQQMGEGWFPSLDDVPSRAVSMSIKQIMRTPSIICTVPGAVKAEAVRDCLEKEISPAYPASILRTHPDCTIFLDDESAALLKKV
ncbi:MAG: glucosamine-6-phosphate deaminase [Spirochaetes bacterium RIFOXYC1_FULL_54_7]|nr:MAG: glucosamine-6-phosphate deaminase [Spirochaetes bacterium RIFOXYC1_FULL_54_7]